MFGDNISEALAKWTFKDQPSIRKDNWATKHRIYGQDSATQMDGQNMFAMAGQTNQTSPINHENKRKVFSCLIECLMEFKHNWPNTIKRDQIVKCS